MIYKLYSVDDIYSELKNYRAIRDRIVHIEELLEPSISSPIDFIPKGNEISRPTENKALLALRYKEDLDLLKKRKKAIEDFIFAITDEELKTYCLIYFVEGSFIPQEKAVEKMNAFYSRSTMAKRLNSYLKKYVITKKENHDKMMRCIYGLSEKSTDN